MISESKNNNIFGPFQRNIFLKKYDNFTNISKTKYLPNNILQKNMVHAIPLVYITMWHQKSPIIINITLKKRQLKKTQNCLYIYEMKKKKKKKKKMDPINHFLHRKKYIISKQQKIQKNTNLEHIKNYNTKNNFFTTLKIYSHHISKLSKKNIYKHRNWLRRISQKTWSFRCL